MRSIPLLSILLLALCLPFVAHPAVAANIVCPSSIVEAPGVSTEVKDWSVVAASGERQLEHVGIYLGSISEHGAQVPDSVKSVKAKETVTWRLTRKESDTFWIGCSYVGTTAMLFQKVDAAVATCVASYDLLPSGKRQRLSAMSCR
jgi:hypothetical protein